MTCSGDLTKLCNHKRKVLALAEFQNSTGTGQESQSLGKSGNVPLLTFTSYFCLSC